MSYRYEPYRMGKWTVGENALLLTFDPCNATFGKPAPYRCVNCGPMWQKPKYHMTHRQTLEGPKEGEVYCEECGSEECGENQDGAVIKVVSRHRTPRINPRRAA